MGKNVTEAQSNVFYKGIEEFGVHGGNHSVPSGISQSHVYSMDWRSDYITWAIDGNPVRTLAKENSTSPMVFALFYTLIQIDTQRRTLVSFHSFQNSICSLGWWCLC